MKYMSLELEKMLVSFENICWLTKYRTTQSDENFEIFAVIRAKSPNHYILIKICKIGIFLNFLTWSCMINQS